MIERRLNLLLYGIGAPIAHLGMLGFGLGYLVASFMPLHLPTLGGIPVVEASVGALILLLFARRFTL